MSCRIYLVAPTDIGSPDLGSPDRSLATFAEVLGEVLGTGAIDCLLLQRGTADPAGLRATIERLRPIAQNLGVAVVLADDAGLARETGCDGVHLTSPKAYRGARKLLGAEAIVGVDCGLSRHLAMEAAERGADYVAFRRQAAETLQEDERTEDETVPSLEAVLQWWQAMIETPCVALEATDENDCAALAEAGADFVTLWDDFWSAERNAVQTVTRIAERIT